MPPARTNRRSPPRGNSKANSDLGFCGPTYVGYLNSYMDAFLVLSAVLLGQLPAVSKRPALAVNEDGTPADLIKSGHVFVYNEAVSNIKRWTDGKDWSPSRVQGKFLLYRATSGPVAAGEKKKAKKVSRDENNLTPGMQRLIDSIPIYARDRATTPKLRALVGSLVDSYQFTDDGLLKKTITLEYNTLRHHVVAYYSVQDVIMDRLEVPSKDPFFHNINVCEDLIQSQPWLLSYEDDPYRYYLDAESNARILSLFHDQTAKLYRSDVQYQPGVLIQGPQHPDPYLQPAYNYGTQPQATHYQEQHEAPNHFAQQSHFPQQHHFAQQNHFAQQHQFAGQQQASYYPQMQLTPAHQRQAGYETASPVPESHYNHGLAGRVASVNFAQQQPTDGLPVGSEYGGSSLGFGHGSSPMPENVDLDNMDIDPTIGTVMLPQLTHLGHWPSPHQPMQNH